MTRQDKQETRQTGETRETGKRIKQETQPKTRKA